MDILTTDRRLLEPLKAKYERPLPRGTMALDKLLYGVACLDATQYLRLFPDSSVDLVLTDEPYAVYKKVVESANVSTDWAWDGVIQIDISDLLTVPSKEEPRLPSHLQTEWVFEVARILKPGGALLNFGHVEFTSTFRDVCKYAGLNWKASGPWIKTTAMPSLTKKNFKSGHEHFFLASKGVLKELVYLEEPEMMNYVLSTECLTCGEVMPVSFSNDYKHPEWWKEWVELSRRIPPKKSKHPTEKPEWLITKFLKILGGKDKVVVDPFCGSGTTLAVAAKYGMKWSGNDFDAKWASYALERARNVMTFI